ncbi:MAG: hypothetical protein V1853_05625 [bacterium]
MPKHIMVLMVVMLVLYSYGILSFRYRRRAMTRYAVAILFGVMIDWFTSYQMFQVGSHGWNIHTILGGIALLMMTALVFPAGYLVYYYFSYDWSPRSITFIKRYGPWAYGVWVVSFITGALNGMGVI